MSSTKATSQEQPGIVAGLLAFVGCAVFSCIAWYPLGGPVYAIALAFRGFGCGNVAPGSTTMFFCSAGVALLQLLPAAIALVLIFVFRKPLMRWVQGITPKLSPGIQFLVAPAVATCLFVIVWAGVHYTLPIQTGLLPQIIFPAVIGLFTFIVVRYSEGLQRALDPFFESRDRFPRWLRFVGVLAVPLLLSVLITQPWRTIVAAGPQLEHFIVLVALVVAFLLLAPRAGELAPIAVRSGGRGSAQARGGKDGMVRLVLKGSGYVVCRLALAVGMAAALHVVLDLCTPEVALAHDCTPDRPWDCQNTGGFNTTTATASGVAGAGAAAAGAGVAGAEAGGAAGTAAGTDGYAPVRDPTGAGGDLGGGEAPPTTEILGGRDALQWLRRQGIIDGTGRPTWRYNTWRGSPGGTFDLEALAGNVRDDGRFDENISVIVRTPPIHQQEINDSCTIASTRMANQRLTGTDVPEANLRAQSQGQPGGYQQNPANFGTSTQGHVNLANAQPNLNARNQNLTLPQMQQQIENGNEVTVSYQLPGGGGHRVVVNNVQAQPEGPALIQIHDPWDQSTRWVDERWWARVGNPGRTLVIEPTGNAAPPTIPPP